jgi:DNA-binding FadR family transcriptional regulator
VETLLRDPRTVTGELLRQILEFRRHIALQVLDLAARNRTAEQLARARALLEREERVGHDPKAALELDVAMNALLGEATGNLMYQLVTNLFTKLVRRLGPIYYNEERDYQRSLDTHRSMLDAIARRDAAEARRILGVMLDYSERAILETAERLETQGLIGPGAGGPP